MDCRPSGQIESTEVSIARLKSMCLIDGLMVASELFRSELTEDEAQDMHDFARYARRVRWWLGLTQVEVARRKTDSPHETIRNWGQREAGAYGCSSGLLRVLDKAPKTTLRVATQLPPHQQPIRAP